MASAKPRADDAAALSLEPELEPDSVSYPTPEEGRRLFDEAARDLMGISGDEFIRRWEAGEYDATFDQEGYRHIDELAMLIPFARIEP